MEVKKGESFVCDCIRVSDLYGGRCVVGIESKKVVFKCFEKPNGFDVSQVTILWVRRASDGGDWLEDWTCIWGFYLLLVSVQLHPVFYIWV